MQGPSGVPFLHQEQPTSLAPNNHIVLSFTAKLLKKAVHVLPFLSHVPVTLWRSLSIYANVTQIATPSGHSGASSQLSPQLPLSPSRCPVSDGTIFWVVLPQPLPKSGFPSQSSLSRVKLLRASTPLCLFTQHTLSKYTHHCVSSHSPP